MRFNRKAARASFRRYVPRARPRGSFGTVLLGVLTVVLLIVAALLGAPAVAMHVLGAGFTVGRFVHALHFIQADAPRWQRGLGYTLSFVGLLGAAGGVIAHAWSLVF